MRSIHTASVIACLGARFDARIARGRINIRFVYPCDLFCRDYREMPALDRYDQRDIDDDVVEEGFEDREAARLRAEDEMDRAQGRRRTRLPGALLEGAHCSTACRNMQPARAW